MLAIRPSIPAWNRPPLSPPTARASTVRDCGLVSMAQKPLNISFTGPVRNPAAISAREKARKNMYNTLEVFLLASIH